jgi:SAM-dependent methyltransferase
MAAMHPKAEFTGLEKSKRKINKAKEKYKLDNLDFKVGDASSEIFETESLDAIVNSYVLHEVYSGSRYNEQIVSDTLRKQFKMLKKGGIMFIRDYASPPPEEFVQLEMPDVPSTGKELSQLSESDLLIWYAEHARPRQDAGCGGFFLEELPERYPKTRLFRLPYKWAYEFIMRKDDRKHWETELPIEYTFFTEDDFRKELRTLGARVQYSAPHWDEDMIAQRFDGHFRLYADNGASMGHPPTCFVAVSYKMAERKSLRIEERRPSSSEKSSLKITAMRNKDTGEITDVVSRDLNASELIPYRIDSRGYLKIYLHDGVARSITNAVPRGGVNLDGRRWSGHMVEPISVDAEVIAKMEAFDIKHTALFARDYVGIKPEAGAVLEHGPDYYPAPDYIDEKIHTYYMHAQKAKGTIVPKAHVGMSETFQAKGFIREIDAQQVLDAITVGMIPNSRLELQILSLFQHLKMKAETWTDKKLNLQINKLVKSADTSALLRAMSEPDERFKAVKGTAGQLRSIHSTFVEEGQSRGAMSGLSAESVDFIVHDGETINTAVILPLTKGLKGDIHAGFNIKYMPVPQRHEGNGMTATAPTLNIPPEIVNNKQLKKFIADEYGIDVSSVFKMGESYFSHVGVTPRRIHPFAIAAPPDMMKDPDSHFIPFYQMMLLQRMLAKEPHLMTVLARSYRYFHEEMQLEAKHDVKAILKQRFENLQPDWSLPIHYENMDLAREHLDEKIHEQNASHDQEIAQKHKHDEEERLRQKQEEEAHTLAAKRAAGATAEQAAAAVKADIAEKYKPKEGSDLTSSFESELEEFMEQFTDDLKHSPVPEKW